MHRQRLIWQIFLPMLLVTFISVAAAVWYASVSLHTAFLQQTEDDLLVRAGLVRNQLASPFLDRDFGSLARLAKEVSEQAGARLTVINNSGLVVSDSMAEPGRMDNHADRTEFSTALQGSPGTAIRYSRTLDIDMLYVALPLLATGAEHGKEPAVAGALRLAVPIRAIKDTLQGLSFRIISISSLLVVLAAIITWAVSRRITRPLEEMRHSAEAFARGDLDRKIRVSGMKRVSVEVRDLAGSMNQMAGQLNERINLVTEQHNELEAVFSGMAEAVLVIDMEERFIKVNEAAVRLLGLPPEGVTAKPVLEVIRNNDLLGFVRAVLTSEQPSESDIILREGGEEIHLQAHGTLLTDLKGARSGGLIVLHDITRIQRLENMRRDFVANVSHELKTPITTIKGFAETLKDGALESPTDAARFTDIIIKHADRLNAIVDDLLTLSRIEQEDEQQEIVLEPGDIGAVLHNVLETCSIKARDKEISLEMECGQGIRARINTLLLEQALTNLVVNAIKYSDPGRVVALRVRAERQGVCIEVADNGVGISREHLPRLFERFYRSDKARSRKLGGTGLGLAIVKHIVQAHEGRVAVDSVPGQGTTFTIILPGLSRGEL